jgi:hypothetical protein
LNGFSGQKAIPKKAWSKAPGAKPAPGAPGDGRYG